MTSLGSTVATILIISISLIFQKFVSTFGRHNEIYGPIGTVIIMQIFIYLNSFALLIGFELNVSIRNAKEKIEQLETEQSL
jgi:membrane protein